MRRRGQHGMTLIELLVAMAVMSILLLGLSSVFFNVSSRYQDWAHRLQTASVGASLAASLQSDSHRYVACDSMPLSQEKPFLTLCAPDQPDSPTIVTYQVTGTGPWVITRQQGGQATTFMARSDTQPTLWIDCIDNGTTLSGHIHVYDFRLPSDSLDPTSEQTFSVYYVAPRGARRC